MRKLILECYLIPNLKAFLCIDVFRIGFKVCQVKLSGLVNRLGVEDEVEGCVKLDSQVLYSVPGLIAMSFIKIRGIGRELVF